MTKPKIAMDAARRAMFEQIFDALIDADYPATENALEKMQSEENIREYEKLVEFEEAKRIYDNASIAFEEAKRDKALKNKNLDIMVESSSNEDLRREILSRLMQGQGRVLGSGNPLAQSRAQRARHFVKLLRSLWPSLGIEGLPKYSRSLADKIVEAFVQEKLAFGPLPKGWQKAH